MSLEPEDTRDQAEVVRERDRVTRDSGEDRRALAQRAATETSGPLRAIVETEDDGASGGFRIEDAFEYDRERDEIEAMLFKTAASKRRIGRFTILDRLGQGAMGTVYAAYDDQLDRKVAVKVIRRRGRDAEPGSARLLREAQAMARLSHPNIVTVHETGQHEGSVFVAMEFVRGCSLDAWLGDGSQPRGWREVVEVFRQAGAGLAAAHRAGIVHRDFKPHNVMRSDEGVVKVLDFGLARSLERPDDEDLGDRSQPSERAPALGSNPRALAARLTATGAMLGTPAYMSPEQCLGQPPDERSDQFSFCVALFEGLYGERPFAGKTLAALFDSVLRGEVRELPRSTTARVPGWIHRVVLQGLAVEPDHRHPSMAQLVELLARDPAQARRRWALGMGSVGLALATGALGLTLASPPTPAPPPAPCRGAATALAKVHAPARLERAREAIEATGLDYATDTWDRISPRISSYAEQWVASNQRVCEAHHDGRMSSALFDRATACLAKRRASFDTLLGLLENADAGVVGRAVDAVAALPPVDVCSDAAWLAAELPRPAEPERAAKVDAARARLARGMMMHSAGQVDEARELVGAVHREAEALADEALLAETELGRGTIAQDSYELGQADASLGRALSLALAVDHDEVAAETVARRLYVRGTLQLHLAQARVDADYGAALIQKTAADSPLRWLYFNNVGTFHDVAGEPDLAGDAFAQAFAELDGQPESIELAATYTNRALLVVRLQDFAGAIADERRALAIAERLYGTTHPRVVDFIFLLAHTLGESGAVDESIAMAERSLALRTAAFGSDNPGVRLELRLLAQLANGRRRYAQAMSLLEAAPTVSEPDFLAIELGHQRGTAQIGLGQLEAGLASHREALALANRYLADSSSTIFWSQLHVAEALRIAGRHAQALEQARVAVEHSESDESLGAQERIAALLELGQTQLALGQLGQAQESLERAQAEAEDANFERSPIAGLIWARLAQVARARADAERMLASARSAMQLLVEQRDEHDPELAAVRFLVAQALGPENLEAQRLAEAAHASFEALGSGYEVELEQVKDWQATATRGD